MKKSILGFGSALTKAEQNSIVGGVLGAVCGVSEADCSSDCAGHCVELACGSGTGGSFLHQTTFVCISIGNQ